MVICPIAMAVHCTGCPLVKFCPAKTILGDYGKETGEDAKGTTPEASAPGSGDKDDPKSS